ncbi:MAG: glycosyltransferase family 39 protein [Elusimicrobia bacterium]|nr:glycosyltransferase family 39 protein [Elusimicrobiota bacterium]
MKRPWLYAAISLCELALLVYYFFRTGLAMTPGAVLGSFTWSPPHGVFDAARFSAVWGTSLSGALIAAIWLALAAGAGAAAVCALDWKAESRLEHFLISLGLGLGGLSLCVFALCVLHLLYPAAVLGLAVGLLAFNARRWRHLSPAKASWGWPSAEQEEPLALAAALGLALLAFHLIGALVPPSGFDEMDYQLSLPKLYQMNHGFVSTPFSHFSYMPKNINMLYLLGLVSGGPVVAKLFAWTLSLLATLALYAFSEKKLGRRGAGLAAFVFFFTPVIGNQFRAAAPDMGTAFFELVGLFLLLRWLPAREPRTLVLSAVFWGLALGSKYTAFPDFAACLLALAWFTRSEGVKPALKSLVPFAATAIVVLSPWLVKNWWETGNPFNPLLSTVITSKNFFFAGRYKATVDYTRGIGIPNYFPINTVQDLLFLPWRMVVSHNDYNHDLGPVWLLLVPLSVLSLKRKPSPWFTGALVFAGFYWFFWLCQSIHITRYFTGGMALASLAAGWLLDAVPERGRWRWALLLPVYLAWFQQSARMVVIQNVYKKPWGYLAGRASLGEYLQAVMTDCPYDAIEYINDTAPPGVRVLVFNEFRTFYLDRDFLASTPWDHDYWLEMIRQSSTPDELLAKLKARGVTYFLANDSFRRHQTGMTRADEWTADDLALERRLLPRVLKQVYRGGEGAWVALVKDRAS